MQLSFREFQALLIAHGFDLPKFGADGYWGDESAAAMKRWAASGRELLIETNGERPPPPPLTDPIPPSWLSPVKMKRIINHWTAGAHRASAHDRKFYHILIEADGKLVRGTHSIADNVSTADDNYAGHTGKLNTGSIGVSACACAGAIEIPYYPGKAPFTKAQWAAMVAVNAQLCRAYKISVSRKTVLSHCEVPKELGIPQVKWDIAQVSFYTETWTALGDKFRDEVRAAL